MRITFALTISFLLFILTLESLSWVLVEKTRWSNIQVFNTKYPDAQTLKSEFSLRTDWEHWEYKGPAPLSKEREQNNFCEYEGPVYEPYSKCRHYCLHSKTNETIFDAQYGFDSLGRRKVPLSYNNNSDYHIAFAGCSHMFGQGMADHQSLPGRFQKLNPQFRVVNLARMGGSVSDLIFQLTEKNMAIDLSSNGLLLISFIDQLHVRRFLLSIHVVGTWFKEGPVIEYDKTKRTFVYKGTANKVYPLYTGISALLMSSRFFKILGLDWPDPTDIRNYYKYVEAIESVRQIYRRRNKNREVIVILDPLVNSSNGIIDALEEKKIPYLDYTKMPLDKISEKKLFFDWDGHPTAEYNRILASQISHDLQLAENQKFLKILQR